MSFLLATIALLFLVYDHVPSSGYTTYEQDKALLDSLVAQMEIKLNKDTVPFQEGRVLEGRETNKEKRPIFFAFNPNHLPVDSLIVLGIPPALAGRIENYRQKGGKFRKQEDLLRIYGFPDSLYRTLEPFIVLSPSTEKSSSTSKKESEPSSLPSEREESNKPVEISRFDINLADSLQLQKVKGIGPVLSSRIIRFRNKLGGFVRLEQLYEVYGLDSTVVQKLVEWAYVQEGFSPEPIMLNSASQEKLAEHPYINQDQARLIFSYRSEHGPFQKLSDLRKIHTLDPNFVNIIAPYVRLQ